MSDPPNATTTATGAMSFADRVANANEAAKPARSRASRTEKGGSKRRMGVIFWICIGWLGLVLFGAVFANLLPLPDPNLNNLSDYYCAPSIHHLLGCDTLGRDVLSRIVYGSRVSLVVGFGAVFIGLAIGGTLGLISGYFGGKIDFVLSAVLTIPLAIPPLILLLAVSEFVGKSVVDITGVLGALSIPLIFRLVRPNAQAFAQREFVTAARALGAKDGRIIMREVLPNVVMTTLSFVFVAIGIAILAESVLSFLGVSVPPPTPTWGVMINLGTSNLEQSSTLWLAPAIVLLMTVLALNIAGDRLRVFFGVKESFL